MALPLPYPQTIDDTLSFWAGAKNDWFVRNPDLDRRFGDRFAFQHEDARTGVLQQWQETPKGCLALMILLDQYPRHAFRGTRHVYATDADARRIARLMAERRWIERVEADMRVFCLLPFAHSENVNDQAISVDLHRRFLLSNLGHALRHQKIIDRFGRFPHRNALLGRPSRPDERAYLKNGGFQG